ncbi:hypothetical protein BDZ45DRAFT_743522 [Acephala macrosclerotiorum]|nr:hypothetical protein BDZ45DRAFT_743522 [Acephala macrosclerotiorum]
MHRSWPHSTPTNSPTPIQTPTHPKKKTNVTDIVAGSTVGGIVLLVAGISSLFFLRKCQTRNNVVSADQSLGDDKIPAEAGDYPSKPFLELPAKETHQDPSELTGGHAASEIWSPPVELPAIQMPSHSEVNGDLGSSC